MTEYFRTRTKTKTDNVSSNTSFSINFLARGITVLENTFKSLRIYDMSKLYLGFVKTSNKEKVCNFKLHYIILCIVNSSMQIIRMVGIKNIF